MQEKFKDFQILHGREEKINPKLTAYQVELAQVEAEIEKLLDTSVSYTHLDVYKRQVSMSLFL